MKWKSNSQMWSTKNRGTETASGIEAKGKELGIFPDQFPSFPHFKTAVMRAAMKAA